MDDWFVQVKGCGRDGGGVSYFAEKVNGLVAPPSWVEVIYVIPLSRGLNLNLSSMSGRSQVD